MLLLGIDLGTSAIKVSVVDAASQRTLASASYPDKESPIVSVQTGWAEQDPEQWWYDVRQCILRAHATGLYNPADIGAIGIAYQMHGLVLTNAGGQVLRHGIIWCDSRAVPYGEKAFQQIGPQTSLQRLLNSPGNFTAAKLAWVKENEPELYAQAAYMMLPGDYIAYRLTGQCTTTSSALSEGILWDFEHETLSKDVMQAFGFDEALIPPVQPVFSSHGGLMPALAQELRLPAGIPVSYKAGDQPNNALALNVMQPGEVATTAGTSGVIYGVGNAIVPDQQSRLNCFAHVNHSAAQKRIGLLLCINGCGIMNKMAQQWLAPNMSYAAIDEMATTVPAGSQGVQVLPFGNGAERMLGNALVNAHILHLDLNKHTTAHLLRATQEGIVYAFRYGFDIMREMGMLPSCIKAGNANMFHSRLFTQSFVNLTGVPVELYHTDGATGAALGAGIGAGQLAQTDLGHGLQLQGRIEPQYEDALQQGYQQWLHSLQALMS